MIGSSAALFVDRSTGIVYNKDELEKLIPYSLLKSLTANSNETWTDTVELLAAGPLTEGVNNNAIGLIPLGKISDSKLYAFSEKLKHALNGRELLVSRDIRKTNRCSTQVLITSEL